jgi:hypothetical protein
MICFACANHFIKLLNFEKLFMLIQPVPWVFGYELLTPMLLKSQRKFLKSILQRLLKFF